MRPTRTANELDGDFPEVLRRMPCWDNDVADGVAPPEPLGTPVCHPAGVGDGSSREGAADIPFGCKLDPIPDEDHACYP